MGLNISAFSGLQEVSRDHVLFNDNGFIDDSLWDRYQQFYIDESMPLSWSEGINKNACYNRGQVVFRFYVGSHYYYSRFLEQLYLFSRMICPEGQNDSDLPFYELVFSSCNEGTLGPFVSKKLCNDFKQNKTFVNNPAIFSPESLMSFTDFTQLYDLFLNGFNLARDKGAFVFH